MKLPLGHAVLFSSFAVDVEFVSAWPSDARPERRFTASCMGRLRRLRPADNVAALDDRVLLRRLEDPDAMTELISRHRQRLMVMATSMIRNRSDAEEIVQDTFVQAYRSAGSFRGDAKVSTWLHSICYRQVLTRTRRKRHLTIALDATSEPAHVESDHAFRLTLDAAVSELPDNNREAFILVEVLGFSRTDAAEVAGIEANTMRARVARAHSLLTTALSNEETP